MLRGYVHPEWIRSGVDFNITALDLKSAYKQLPLSPKDYGKAVVSLWDQQVQDIRCFIARTLPFGASGSVRNFLRISEFLQAVGSEMGILWANYFDDFPMVSHRLHTASTMAGAKGILALMGFDFAEDKLEPFGHSAEVLGVVVNLAECNSGRIIVENKPSRVEELKEVLEKLERERVVVPAKLPSILGKLQYADSHVWEEPGNWPWPT